MNVLADYSSQHIPGIAHDSVEVEKIRFKNLLAAESEKLASQDSRTLPAEAISSAIFRLASSDGNCASNIWA